MQILHKDHLIRHASGDPKSPFIYGFYLFYILPVDKGKLTPFYYNLSSCSETSTCRKVIPTTLGL